MDDDKKRQASPEELRAEKERLHKHSLKYGIEQARETRARMEDLKGNATAQKLDNLINLFKNINIERIRIRNNSHT